MVLLWLASALLVLIGLWLAWQLLIAPLLTAKLFSPNAKPLTAQEVAICARIVKEGKGYPYVCKQAVKTGRCPCLPCDKLNRAKALYSTR